MLWNAIICCVNAQKSVAVLNRLIYTISATDCDLQFIANGRGAVFFQWKQTRFTGFESKMLVVQRVLISTKLSQGDCQWKTVLSLENIRCGFQFGNIASRTNWLEIARLVWLKQTLDVKSDRIFFNPLNTRCWAYYHLGKTRIILLIQEFTYSHMFQNGSGRSCLCYCRTKAVEPFVCRYQMYHHYFVIQETS